MTIAISTPESLYLELLKRCLVNWIYPDAESQLKPSEPWVEGNRKEGKDWPYFAHTMIGMERLSNIQHLVWAALQDGVPGDLVECGIWRGGATIFMRALLEVFDPNGERLVWGCDSFRGVPAPHPDYPQDRNMTFHQNNDYLGVSRRQVMENFNRYGLWDERTVLVEGLFGDTLPPQGLKQIAVLRVDADLYESTSQVLKALEPLVQPGGFVIVDDYVNIPPVQQATTDYLARTGKRPYLQQVDWSAVFWRK